jgi:hypothetical protein
MRVCLQVTLLKFKKKEQAGSEFLASTIRLWKKTRAWIKKRDGCAWRTSALRSL